MKKSSLTQFGTYGFMSALLAIQVASAPRSFADDLKDKANRAGLDAKKSARAMKRDVKKGARKATGQESTYESAKDEVKDAGKNVKDEAEHLKEEVSD